MHFTLHTKFKLFRAILSERGARIQPSGTHHVRSDLYLLIITIIS